MTLEQLKQKAHSLPLLPGVYLMQDKEGGILYVGKAKNLRSRVSSYFQDAANHTEKTRLLVSLIDDLDVIVADSEFEALVLECALIKRHMPRYNILLKDGKAYPYIRLSVQEAYPRFSLVNRPGQDGAKYFGPFGGRKNSQDIIDALRLALRLPACNRVFPRDIGKERPCLNHHLGRCEGYCRAERTQEQHAEAVRQAVRLLEGKFSEVEAELEEAMLQAAEALEFEKAATLRDRLQAIERLGQRQKVVAGRLDDHDVIGLYQGEMQTAVSVLHYQKGQLAAKDTEFLSARGEAGADILLAFVTQYYTSRSLPPARILLPLPLEGADAVAQMLSERAGERVELLVPQRGEKAQMVRMAEANAREDCLRADGKEERVRKLLRLLAETLELAAPPKRIEAYDISNTGDADIVGAMTVFVDGQAKKGQYRRFRLKTLRGADDYAAMAEVLTRRFLRDARGDRDFAEGRPDLLLIDGGAEHAKLAKGVLEHAGLEIPVFGMVKDEKHRTRALMSPQGEEIGIRQVPALFSFVGRIQEETHSTAVNFHQRRRSKSARQSALEQIPGIGEARRKKLLAHFRSVKAIREAERSDLEAVLPRQAAKSVYEYFHPEED